MYKIKNVARRATAFSAAVLMLAGLGTSVLPTLAHADALNPLTERSLLLSSSSPGFHYLDGSGNTTYAPPGSGPNGKQTGETFSFKVSTNSSNTGTNQPLKAFTFQYCVTAAGQCRAPGDNTGNANPAGSHTPDRGADTTSTSDLNVNYTSPVHGTDFDIYVGDMTTPIDSTGWTMSTSSKEDFTGTWTGKKNFITLVNGTSSTIQPTAGQQMKIVFKASSTNYITNPGSGAFFVKINDYNSDTDIDPLTSTSIVDGGVTVANVMTDSIQIQTKVLETMSFSVGTTNPDTVVLTNPAVHGPCDAITTNVPLKLGDSTAEYSLSPSKAYDAYSYWRLSSNSSGGATVYYSGATLSNTVGDQIDSIGNVSAISHPGAEQFGLGIDSTADTYDPAFDTLVSTNPTTFQNPHLTPLAATLTGTSPNVLDYGNAAGGINTTDPGGITALFAFKPDALSIPQPIASENTDVVHCSTAKIRYVANIAPDTPAGIYTTAINYLAAPQY